MSDINNISYKKTSRDIVQLFSLNGDLIRIGKLGIMKRNIFDNVIGLQLYVCYIFSFACVFASLSDVLQVYTGTTTENAATSWCRCQSTRR